MPPKQRKRHSNESKPPKKEETNEESISQNSEGTENSQENQSTPGFYGVTWKKILARIFISVGVMLALYSSANEEMTYKTMAAQKDSIDDRFFEVKCSADYKRELSKYKGCAPQVCGRMVSDVLTTPSEASKLVELAKKGMALGKVSGGVSILDLHSGALSQGKSFVNIYKIIKSSGINDLFTEEDFKVYKNVREKIQHMIAFRFGVSPNALHLTHPTFFSKLTDKPPQTIHDEYWHVHVDKKTYPSFHYTSLLYLSDYGIDFTGGRFVFLDPKLNITVEPKMGRVSAFTSGSENPHFVERVRSGTRYALTVSFTCDPSSSIRDPSLSGSRKVKA